MSLERQFLDHLVVIDQVVQFIGGRHRLPADAMEELQSAIHLKIIDNNYEVLRKFEGRSSIRTYLTACRPAALSRQPHGRLGALASLRLRATGRAARHPARSAADA